MLSSVQRLLYTERAWYHYRRDNENASANSKGKIYCVCDEFAEIWRYLRKYPKKLDAVRYFIPPAQFRRYGETKGRISEEHYWEFEERMLYDLDQLAEEGYIEESYWSKDAWSDYQQQIKAYDDHSAILQYWRMVHGYIGNSIVVFGAGKVALRVIERLRQEGIAIEAVIVSDPGMNPSEIAGIQVFSLMDYSEKNKTVLVCLKAENLYIVLRRLRQAGYTNVLVADVLFREILGKNVKKLY